MEIGKVCMTEGSYLKVSLYVSFFLNWENPVSDTGE